MAGYRIGPFDVESVLVLQGDIIEAVPDEVRGEVFEGFGVLRTGAVGDDELEAELQNARQTKDRLANALTHKHIGRIAVPDVEGSGLCQSLRHPRVIVKHPQSRRPAALDDGCHEDHATRAGLPDNVVPHLVGLSPVYLVLDKYEDTAPWTMITSRPMMIR